jgi:hypothetical protein
VVFAITGIVVRAELLCAVIAGRCGRDPGLTAAVVLAWGRLAAVSVKLLSGRWYRVDARVCSPDGKRWIVSAIAG